MAQMGLPASIKLRFEFLPTCEIANLAAAVPAALTPAVARVGIEIRERLPRSAVGAHLSANAVLLGDGHRWNLQESSIRLRGTEEPASDFSSPLSNRDWS